MTPPPVPSHIQFPLPSSSCPIHIPTSMPQPPPPHSTHPLHIPIPMSQVLAQHMTSLMSQAPDPTTGSTISSAFLQALPEDIRQEVLNQERQIQESQRAREAAASAAAPGPQGPSEMDPATFLATLPPDLRQEILMTTDESVLQTLPLEVAAEAYAMRERERERAMRHLRNHRPLQVRPAPVRVGVRARGAACPHPGSQVHRTRVVCLGCPTCGRLPDANNAYAFAYAYACPHPCMQVRVRQHMCSHDGACTYTYTSAYNAQAVSRDGQVASKAKQGGSET